MTPPLRAVANPSQLTLEGQRVAQKCQWWPLFAIFIQPSFWGEAKSTKWKIYPITIVADTASVMSLQLKHNPLKEEIKITFGHWPLIHHARGPGGIIYNIQALMLAQIRSSSKRTQTQYSIYIQASMTFTC